MNSPLKSRPGFTLIELLVALAVFAVLSVMAYGGLDTVLKAREATDKEALRLAKVQRTFLWLKRDIEQSVARSVRGDYGEVQAAFKAVEYGEYLLELTRGGYRNPARLQRSNLQRVGYGLKDNSLYRYSWQYLDRAQDSRVREMSLLDGVTSVRFRLLSAGQQWQGNWPPANTQNGVNELMPTAVEIMLELEDWGRLTRVFLVGGHGT